MDGVTPEVFFCFSFSESGCTGVGARGGVSSQQASPSSAGMLQTFKSLQICIAHLLSKVSETRGEQRLWH